MIETYTTDMQIGAFYADAVEIAFEIERARFKLEPYSWGESRGWEIEVDATLHSLPLGEKTLTRGDLIILIGKRAVLDIETRAARHFADAA